MKFRRFPLGVLLLVAATIGLAQSTEQPGAGTTDQPAKRAVPNGRLPEAKRGDRPSKYGKPTLPDPDLLDGSTYEKEKHPLHGMLSEIEIGENEGGRQDKISPNSGPAGAGQPQENQPEPKAGGSSAPPQETAQSAAAGQTPPEQAAQAGGGGADQKVPEGQMAGGASGPQSPNGQAKPGGAGPAAAAEGMQAASLKVPEGAAGAVGAAAGKPQQMQIGDATLQIQPAKNNPDVVGTQVSTSQQYDKKTPAGGSSAQSSGNVGVEKGRVVPKGL